MRDKEATYSEAVIRLLAARGEELAPMPLAGSREAPAGVKEMLAATPVGKLFPGAFAPEAALSGLWLYFSCLDESHALSQEIGSVEGSFWHGIMHRREPDPSNAGYWFRRVGRHAVFPALLEAAREVGERYPGESGWMKASWDPFAFIDFCERARRQPGSAAEAMAEEIQLVEWKLLFDCCAKPSSWCGGSEDRS